MRIPKGLIIAALLVGSFLLGLLVATANACTGIRLTAADGTVVQARTMEFGVDMESNVIVVPRGYERTGTTPDGQPGMQVDQQVCERRCEWRRPADHDRRRQ